MSHPLFSETYVEARAKFIGAADASGHHVEPHVHPNERAPGGEELSMDVVWFGPKDAKGVLLNLSGTHGCEGFAGSAAQVNWIENRGFEHLPKDTALLMVHGVNPYGFSHFSRCTEDNVDLNRNWIDFSEPLPENPNYMRYHAIQCPKLLNEESEKQILRDLGTLARERGHWEIEDAMSRGQYDVPDGIGFGGQAPTWSREILSGVIRKNLGDAEKVALLDWHTGTPGMAEIIYLCYSEPGTIHYDNAAHLWGEENIRPQKVDEQWGNKRPGRVGVMYWGIRDIVEDLGGECAGGVIEIGTRPEKDLRAAARAGIYDRYLRFESDRFAPENAELLDTILRAFYPHDDEAWKIKALEKSVAIYERTLKGLREWVES